MSLITHGCLSLSEYYIHVYRTADAVYGTCVGKLPDIIAAGEGGHCKVVGVACHPDGVGLERCKVDGVLIIILSAVNAGLIASVGNGGAEGLNDLVALGG